MPVPTAGKSADVDQVGFNGNDAQQNITSSDSLHTLRLSPGVSAISCHFLPQVNLQVWSSLGLIDMTHKKYCLL